MRKVTDEESTSLTTADLPHTLTCRVETNPDPATVTFRLPPKLPVTMYKSKLLEII